MDVIFHPFKILENVIFMPAAEFTGLPEDRVSFDHNPPPYLMLPFSDSLRIFTLRGNISWFLHESCFTSVKS